MSKVHVTYLHNNSIAKVVLENGKGNVLDHLAMEELQHILDSFRDNKHLKFITFEGAGKHFSFGASVEEHKKEYAAAMLREFHQLFYTIRDLSIPCAAKISGQCLGGGLELALMCNFLFADKTALMGQPEIILGVFPPPASVLLPLKIGYAKAEELLITGKTITAAEGKMLGLINEVYEDKTVMEESVNTWISRHILPKSASSLRFAVKAARVKFNHIIGNFLPQLESMYVYNLMETHDANEGISSFIEKRSPLWQDN